MLEKKGYYISPLYNLIVFYGDSFDSYNHTIDDFENITITKNMLDMINGVFEYEYIGEL